MESTPKSSSRLLNHRRSAKDALQIAHAPVSAHRKQPSHRCHTQSDRGCACNQATRSIAADPLNSSRDSGSGKWVHSSLVEPPREKNSDEEMAHFLLNEILLIVGGLNRFNREKITFLEFLEVLRELNMIPPSYEPCSHDQVYDLWALLCQGNKDLSACLINYAILLLAVMDIKGQPAAIKRFFESVPLTESGRMTLPNRKRSSHAPVVENPFRKNKEGYFELTRQEVRRIYKSFQQFRVTRMHLGQIERKVELFHDKSVPRYPFQPLISSRSREMPRSQSRRKCSDHHISTRDKENDQCTFQPNLHRSSSRTKATGLRKSEELYRLSRNKDRRLREDDKKQEPVAPKEQECTFHPKISSFSKKKLSNAKIVERSQAEERQIERLKKARLEKELSQAFQKTGTTPTEKTYTKLRADLEKALKPRSPAVADRVGRASGDAVVEQQHTCSPEREEAIPKQSPAPRVLMTIQVYICEGQVHNLTVYEGARPQDIAKEFSRTHSNPLHYVDLDSKMCTQLTKEIETAVKYSLCQIEEESVECSEEC